MSMFKRKKNIEGLEGVGEKRSWKETVKTFFLIVIVIVGLGTIIASGGGGSGGSSSNSSSSSGTVSGSAK